MPRAGGDELHVQGEWKTAKKLEVYAPGVPFEESVDWYGSANRWYGDVRIGPTELNLERSPPVTRSRMLSPAPNEFVI